MGLIKMYARPIKYKVNGPGTEETADGFVASPVRYSTISVEDLADHISADSRVERSKVAVITDSLIKQIREMVLNGHKIIIPHLGSFKPKIKSNLAINPESVDAASFTAKVQFTPSVELKRDLQASRIEKTTLPTAPEAPSLQQQLDNAVADFKLFSKNALAKLGLEDTYDLEEVLYQTKTVNSTKGDEVIVSILSVSYANTVAPAQQKDPAEIQFIDFLKARDKNAMGRSYYYFDGDGNILDVVPVLPSGVVPAENRTAIYSDGRYKFTEPFKAGGHPNP